jgi:hypothetical protein
MYPENMNGPYMVSEDGFNTMFRLICLEIFCICTQCMFCMFMRQKFYFTGLESGTLLIHMGRDHGLPGYQHWHQLCTHNLTQALSPSMKKLLQTVYTYVHNTWQYLS